MGGPSSKSEAVAQEKAQRCVPWYLRAPQGATMHRYASQPVVEKEPDTQIQLRFVTGGKAPLVPLLVEFAILIFAHAHMRWTRLWTSSGM